MIRLFRIACVVTITLILGTTFLMINKSIDLFNWINYSKLLFSILISTLIYLLLDQKRNSLIGKISLLLAISGSVLLILSSSLLPLNNTWNIVFSLYISSFILLLYCNNNLNSKALKGLFYFSLIIPIGITIGLNQSMFYSISGVILSILSGTTIYLNLKKS
jgi:hypothetical protein